MALLLAGNVVKPSSHGLRSYTIFDFRPFFVAFGNEMKKINPTIVYRVNDKR